MLLHHYSALQQFIMKNSNKNLLTQPKKPNPDECCGGGSCSPCVWDEYKQALAKWQVQERHKSTNKETVL